jgi:hypothetical protein
MYSYELLVISDSKDHRISFWQNSEMLEIIPGFAIYLPNVGAADKLFYARDSKNFTFGSVEIARNYEDFSLDKLVENDYVVIRFDKNSGYVVTIIRENEHNGIDRASRFECKHNKISGLRYSTSVKKLDGANGEFDFDKGTTGAFFSFAQTKLLDIYAGMTELFKNNFKNIGKTAGEINKLNNKIRINKFNKLVGGEIGFYFFDKLNKWHLDHPVLPTKKQPVGKQKIGVKRGINKNKK